MRWLSAAGNKTLDGRRPGRGINPVAMDEAVIGAATTRWTTAPMKGSWSGAVYERRPSLAVDDAVLVGAPAWWRTAAMDGVEDGGDGWGGGRRLVWGWCSSEDDV